jgi:hypothetical protein
MSTLSKLLPIGRRKALPNSCIKGCILNDCYYGYALPAVVLSGLINMAQLQRGLNHSPKLASGLFWNIYNFMDFF